MANSNCIHRSSVQLFGRIQPKTHFNFCLLDVVSTVIIVNGLLVDEHTLQKDDILPFGRWPSPARLSVVELTSLYQFVYGYLVSRLSVNFFLDNVVDRFLSLVLPFVWWVSQTCGYRNWS